MLDFCGIEKERLRARWVSSAEAPEFVEEINDFVDVLKKLGPSPLKKERADAVA
jgi:F420-non-reducing hydrogenase iron-sulfur subunit